MKPLLIFGLALFLSACGSPEVSTPAPTPEAINIIYPTALQPWADKLARCASSYPQIALYFKESNALDTDIQLNDIGLEFGQPDLQSTVTYLSQVGREQVVVVVNQENSLSQLSSAELKSIFSGQRIKPENGSDQSTQVWVLPQGEPTRGIFDHAVMLDRSLTTESMLAPDPAAMLKAISQNIDAIGYLPASILTTNDPSYAGKVKIVQLDPSLEAELRQPVIAITLSEPKGLMRNILVCLEVSTP
jgi:hypothetical protein